MDRSTDCASKGLTIGAVIKPVIVTAVVEVTTAALAPRIAGRVSATVVLVQPTVGRAEVEATTAVLAL